MNALFELQRATLAARERTGDKAIGTRAHAGKVDVVRVVYDARGKATVSVLSGPHTATEAVVALGAL